MMCAKIKCNAIGVWKITDHMLKGSMRGSGNNDGRVKKKLPAKNHTTHTNNATEKSNTNHQAKGSATQRNKKNMKKEN